MSEIMSFEEFTNKVKDTLVSHLPPEFSGTTVDIQRRRKVNGESQFAQQKIQLRKSQ